MILFILICLFTALLQNVGAECPAIISKNEWDGAKPKHRQYLSTPLDLVIIQHTVTHLCNNDQSCISTVKDIQRIHQNEAFLWDIGPSFLIANTGKIYEGRGWNYVPVHTVGYNNQSFGIAFIGTFNNQEPSLQALDSSRALMACGVELGRLTPNHKVVLQKQLIPTESPGKKLTSKIMSWPNWIRDVTEITKRIYNKGVNNLLNTPVDQNLLSTEVKTPKIYILTTPKEIDHLSDKRDLIAEIINNIYKLARQTLYTLETLALAITGQINLFREGLIYGLRTHKDRINAAARAVSIFPGVAQCSTQIQERANNLYDDTELKIQTCAENKVNEVKKMIENLSTVSYNIIDFANTAVEETKNCTELNFGIKSLTEACLNSVTRRTQNLAQTYESQSSVTINSITKATEAFPGVFNSCSKNVLPKASTQTEEMVLQFVNCKPSLSIPISIFPGFN